MGCCLPACEVSFFFLLHQSLLQASPKPGRVQPGHPNPVRDGLLYWWHLRCSCGVSRPLRHGGSRHPSCPEHPPDPKTGAWEVPGPNSIGRKNEINLTPEVLLPLPCRFKCWASYTEISRGHPPAPIPFISPFAEAGLATTTKICSVVKSILFKPKRENETNLPFSTWKTFFVAEENTWMLLTPLQKVSLFVALIRTPP